MDKKNQVKSIFEINVVTKALIVGTRQESTVEASIGGT
jgi:hypothetical protein